MPIGVVKTKAQEQAWHRAKRLARKQKGKRSFYPYVMSIYKKVTGKK